jgi:hypothetical protein
MICPVCGSNHRKFPVNCASFVSSEWGHIILLAPKARSDGERAEIAKRFVSPVWVEKTLNLYKQMTEYMKEFE